MAVLDFFNLDLAALRHTVVSILAAWVMGQAIASVYAWTRHGQDVSRAFVQALVMGGIVGAMLMMAIGNSLARGLGIVGTLALIRFRTNLRDPLDMVFIFASFATGIAAGTGNIATGFVGTALFLGVAASMRFLQAGGGAREADLRLRVSGTEVVEDRVREALKQHCASVALLKRRDVADGKDARMWWRVSLKEGDDGEKLSRALLALEGVHEAQLGLDVAQPAAGGDDD